MNKCKICYNEKEGYSLYCDTCDKKIQDSLEFLTGHISEGSGYIVESYPYGRLRTQIRYWIETTKHGDRFVSQTLNPKTQKWNNPKKSTYSDVMVMSRDYRGYISYISYSVSYTDDKTLVRFMERVKGVPLNKSQLEKLKVAKAILKTREHISYEIVRADGETPEETESRHKEDEANRKQLENIFGYYYNKEV